MSTLQQHAQHNPYAQYASPVMHHYVPPAATPGSASAGPAASPTVRHAQPTLSTAGTVAPNDTFTQPTPTSASQPQTPATQTQSTPLIAQGDWTKNLVHLAKTAELKCVSAFSVQPPPFLMKLRFCLQKACTYVTTTYCPYHICTGNARYKEQSPTRY